MGTRHAQLEIRPENSADRAAIHEVNTLAFKRDNEARLVDALRDSPAFIPALSLVAEIGDHIVGHILFTTIHIGAGQEAVPALALAPLAVRPEQQREGVGSALVHAGLERGRQLGHAIVVVLGHPAYYPRFGFSSARSRGITAPFPARDEAFMVLELRPGGLDGVAGMVEYAQPFSEI